MGPGSIVQKLMDKRLLFLSGSCFLQATRVTQQGAFRSAQLYSYIQVQPNLGVPPPGAIYGLAGQRGTQFVNPDLCILVKVPGTPITGPPAVTPIPVVREFRGLNTVDISNVANQFQPGGALLGALQQFFAQAVADGWGWIGEYTRTPKDVTAVTQNANGTVHVIAAGNLWTALPTTAQTVRISGIGGASAVNGSRVVIPSALNAFDTKQKISIFPYTAGGKVTAKTSGFINVANPGLNLQALRVSERKAGRISFLSRGRQRVTRVA
jgi:hypothetical protein